jgi:hypothetical protein
VTPLLGKSQYEREYKRTREVTRRYKFVVDGKSVRVCKKLFIATFGIGIKTVDYDFWEHETKDCIHYRISLCIYGA